MKNIVFFDLETQRSFQEVGGRHNIPRLGLSVAVTYSTADGEYRHYTTADEKRLAEIMVLRSAGIKLSEIRRILDDELENGAASVLRQRLTDIAEQIDTLRSQQRITATLLGIQLKHSLGVTFTKETWTALLKEAGFDEPEMHRWHHEFEVSNPAQHAAFLRSLRISESEIAQIREWSETEWE